jgi:hypothetical protein
VLPMTCLRQCDRATCQESRQDIELWAIGQWDVWHFATARGRPRCLSTNGWKGRGLWTTDGNRTPFHRETGEGTLPKIVKF